MVWRAPLFPMALSEPLSVPFWAHFMILLGPCYLWLGSNPPLVAG